MSLAPYLTVPNPTRALAASIAAEAATIRTALASTWTTPESAARAEDALRRLIDQASALHHSVHRLREPTSRRAG